MLPARRARTGVGRVVAALAAALGCSSGAAQPLKVCADPDNLPFSKAEGPERGLYVELAERVAQRLGRPIEYVWYYSNYQRRALRNTIQANACDAYFALPANAEYKARGLQKSVGFLDVGYAIVAPAGFAIKRLADLAGRRVALQFGSTPAVLLAGLEGVTVVTQRTVEDAIDSLANGEADVAFVWGPSAGYDIQRRYAGRWQLTSVSGHGLGGPVSVAVRRDQPALAQAIDKALGELKPEIDGLARKYGFPRSQPVALDPNSALALPTRLAGSTATPVAVTGLPAVWRGQLPSLVTVADSAPTAARKSTKKPESQSPAPAAAEPAKTAALDPAAAAGREKFNNLCSHCHSPDGASPMRERDLRRLKMRYDDKWTEAASKTINEGRPTLGMPTWKDALSSSDIDNVLSFLKTIQK
jgi:ABC-type amino acid transport substrate-binding protein/mono/diheme cytochrome c family protein